jgi:hypothetical protein
MKKPKILQDILPEAVIIKEYGLPVPKSGRSRVISSWIRQGLKYFEISDVRFVLKDDLLDFLWQKHQECQGE